MANEFDPRTAPDRPIDTESDVERDTGQAGSDSERERIEGTPEPGADTIPDEGGAGPGTTAGPEE